jgi:hypothetical protein
MTAYGKTRVAVGQTEGAIKQMLAKRGVTDTRFTTTSALFALEFNWALRHGKRRDSPVRSILGVRIVAPWSADEREQRRIARVLYWHLKSKLEVVESGVLAFEEEFLPHLTLGRGRTVYDTFKPMLDAAIAERKDLAVVMETITGQTIHEALPPPRTPRTPHPSPDEVDGALDVPDADITVTVEPEPSRQSGWRS